jgi:hypothetical protein
MSWHYLNQPYITADPLHQGFVYLIENLSNDRKYIGQKNFWRTVKLKPLKGKTNRRHRREESDWPEYYGSSTSLSQDFAANGPETFKRTILYMCANKNQMNYFETLEQFNREVLFKDEYYNGMINCRITARGLTSR